MNKSTIILIVLLLLSNGLWFYQSLDQGVTNSYQSQQLYELEKTRVQLMKMMPELSSSLPKEKIIEIAARYSETEIFEKDGCSWAGWAGLKFNQSGNLESVSPVWSFGESDPCFQNSK